MILCAVGLLWTEELFSMNRVMISRRKTIVLFFTVVFLLPVLHGCKKDSSEAGKFDSVLYVLKESIRNPEISFDVRKRTDLAISQWENGVIDQNPILLKAVLGKPQEIDKVLLAS